MLFTSQALADMMAKTSKARWGNRFGYILIPFTIALQDGPLDYVRQAKAVIDRKKHSLEAFCTYLIANVLIKIIGAKVPIFPLSSPAYCYFKERTLE